MVALEMDARHELIRTLIPLGLMAVNEELQREVEELVGPRYTHRPERMASRHGSNLGSVRLGGQRVAVRVPRVRGEQGEIPLQSYRAFHRGGEPDEQLFRRMLYGISCRNYEAAAQAIPGAIGLSKSTVSEKFIEVSSQHLRELRERDLSGYDVVSVFLDGKSFSEQQMVVALGVTMTGDKVFLGFVESDTENKRVLTGFLRELLGRGLNIDRGVLVVIDGGKGLNSAVKKAFSKRALIQRCQWHKRENVVSHLGNEEQVAMRTRLQKAYERPSYKEAHRALMKIRKELEERNQSAMRSLDEGLEQTLTLHQLGVFAELGRSFKTTNCLESINAQAEERCQRIDYWKNSSQRQRWFASALLDIEPRLRKVQGYRHLPKLRAAIMRELQLEKTECYALAA